MAKRSFRKMPPAFYLRLERAIGAVDRRRRAAAQRGDAKAAKAYAEELLLLRCLDRIIDEMEGRRRVAVQRRDTKAAKDYGKALPLMYQLAAEIVNTVQAALARK